MTSKVDNEQENIGCGSRNQKFHTINKCRMSYDSGIRSIDQEKNSINKNDQPVTSSHSKIIVTQIRQTINDEVGYYTCDKYNKYVDSENNPSWQVTNIMESFP